ncbi:TetR/AcrR family transcriptional regulator [Nonomuraea sp. NBC_01738]|uniref:TetR/AcrR family transcriptional regulator n=1 Tax=Nonomuraea sp. NBC_01738 TaxID=2976003 RepID=UPI002E103751|nr:TetR/AcrR family transcriptional regulator [Nonomuraea sp. NBC_01738]
MAGLRESKKQRTRQALIEAALRLFEVKGYEETTLAEIAAEADVSTRTFFSYFPSKEDLVFYDSAARMERTIALVGEPLPGETVGAVLLRMVAASTQWAAEDGAYAMAHNPLRLHLIMTVPSLQARALQLLFDSQLGLARALADGFPDRLNRTRAAAAVGALVGATKLAVVASLADGGSLEEAIKAAREAAALTIDGLHTLD